MQEQRPSLLRMFVNKSE